MTFFFMFCFGFYLLGSWAGWGSLINRLLFNQNRAGISVLAGWGLAFTLFVGGLLNLTSMALPITLHIFVGAGFLILLIDIIYLRKPLLACCHKTIQQYRNDLWFCAAVLLLCLMLLILYSAYIYSVNFNTHDDFHGYFVFAEKMIQTGTLGTDPYSERRILTLGGMPFLHALILSTGELRNLNMVDPGLGYVLVSGLLLGMGREMRLSKWATVLVLLVYLIIPIAKVNTTSLVTGTALLLVLFRTLYWLRVTRSSIAPSTLVIGLIVSALISLKTTYIPFCVFFIGSVYLYLLITEQQQKEKIALEALFIGIFSLLFLSPWMIALYQSNGTLLYPLFGSGFHGSVYGTFLLPNHGLTVMVALKKIILAITDAKVLPLFLLGTALLVRKQEPSIARRLQLTFFFAAATTLIVLVIQTGGYSPYRYSFAFIVAATLALMVFAFSDTSQYATGFPSSDSSLVIALLAIGLLIGAHWSYSQPWYFMNRIDSIVSGINNEPLANIDAVTADQAIRTATNANTTDKAQARYAQMQHSIPKGSVVLTRLQYPFLLDFNRNNVLIADYPGGSSPPPGMPFFQGAEKLATYLHGRSLRYIAYSYRSEANFAESDYQQRLSPNEDPWIRTEAEHTFDFQKNITELGSTRKHLYDDGDVFVLDLEQPNQH